MNLPYVKVFGDLSATVDLLSDAEAGRLLKSLLHYINGGEDELLGQEKLVFAMLKSQIDRDSASYAAFTDKQRENGKKGGRPPKANAFSENPKNPSLFSETQKSQEEEKDKDQEKDKDVTGAKAPSRARDGRFDVFWANYRKPDQIINPWQFGHPEQKKTCLWLKNLPLLRETDNVYDHMMTLPQKNREKTHYQSPSPDRNKLRSKTYTGIAKAMAEQWAGKMEAGDNANPDD